jgi:dTDP-glucose 4,6-dehydratase
VSGVVVTGGAGFIGSTVVRQLLERGETVIVLDALTYAGRRENLAELFARRELLFVHGSITDSALVASLLVRHKPHAIVHMAAETHVDRSIDRSIDFVQTNVTGTHTMLEAALAYWRTLSGPERREFRFVQVSTDEVYGSVPQGVATEGAPIVASSPYAATKAAADLLARAMCQTYGLPVVVTRGCNSYGPRQFPEKLIPLLTLRALSARPLPLYGDGKQVREWIYVDDAAAGIIAALDHGSAGSAYNLGSGERLENLQVACSICRLLEERMGVPSGTLIARIQLVTDRPGHDRRYATYSTSAHRILRWHASTGFMTGLTRTIDWYTGNRAWWAPIARERYDLRRLGVPDPAAVAAN